jgi:hypothetical protein
MAYTHSRYKNRAPLDVQVNTPEAHIAADKATEAALPRLIAMAENPGPEIDARDETSRAFQNQIDALRKAEATQNQRQQRATQNGLTPNQMAFLEANPAFPNHPEPAKRALMAAHAEGHAEDSPEFHRAVLQHFNTEIGTIHAGVLADRHREPEPVKPEHSSPRAGLSGRQRQPKMDDEVESMDERIRRGGVPSAWLERSVVDGRSYQERNRGRVTLTAEERDIARRSGISERDYAMGKLDLMQRKANGEL